MSDQPTPAEIAHEAQKRIQELDNRAGERRVRQQEQKPKK